MTRADSDLAQTRRILLLGATGTIGQAVLSQLIASGHDVVCLVRRPVKLPLDLSPGQVVTFRPCDFSAADKVQQDGLRGEAFDAVISCMSSRTGAPKDAWAVDHGAHVAVLEAAKAAGIGQFILLSAICLQKPKLAFQEAKLAFEEKLMRSGLCYSIVRATAYFKSLSGQVDRLRAGKPFLVFGDGTLTACKPISNRDLAAFIVSCLDNPDRQNRILPIGGPGPALTPREQGAQLFEALGRAPEFRQVPIGMMTVIIIVLSVLGTLSPRLRDKAELAKIGRYYATESMLVWDAEAARYAPELTPETGTDSLAEFYQKLAKRELRVDRGDHAVF